MEPGIEVAFTNALIQEFERAKIGRITGAPQAEVLVEGVITSVSYPKSGTDLTSEKNSSMPLGAVLATSHQIMSTTHGLWRRNTDKSNLL